MSEKKRNLVFFQAVMSHGWFVMEKTKNENLIVHAGCGGNIFSFFEFPDSLPDVAFDPEYAERVAGECYGDEIPGGWYDDAVRIVGNFDLWGATCVEFSSSRDEIDYLRRSHDGGVESLKGLANAFVALEKSFSERRGAVQSNAMPEPAVVSSPEVSSPSPIPASPFPRKLLQIDTATGEFSLVDQEPPHGDPREPSPEAAAAANHVFEVLESGIAKRSREGGPLSDAAPQCFGGLTDIFPSLKTSANATPDDAGQPPPASPASLPTGFVAVPLPDDGEPVLGHKRKPGHYLTRGGYFVDLTYNVGTGIDQHPFPWVHFDKHRRGNCYDVFFTEKGEAYRVTRVGSGAFPICHYDHLPDFDIVQKCVHPAAEDDKAWPQEEVKAESKAGDVPDLTIEQIQTAVGPDCEVRVEFVPKNGASDDIHEPMKQARSADGDGEWFNEDQYFRYRVSCEGLCSCKLCRVTARPFVRTILEQLKSLANFHERDLKWRAEREKLESSVSAHLAEVHALNRRIAELARALGSEKQVSVELDAKCDRLTEQWGGIVEVVEKLRNERDEANAELVRVLSDISNVRATLAKRDAECANVRSLMERMQEELAILQAEREPLDNGDGTETRLLPVTYPKGWDVEAVRVPRKGDLYDDGNGVSRHAGGNHGSPGSSLVRLILRPAPKPPEPATWEAPALADGEWIADSVCVARPGYALILSWGIEAVEIRGLTKPAKFGTYQFKDGVGTLIKAADDSGKAGS